MIMPSVSAVVGVMTLGDYLAVNTATSERLGASNFRFSKSRAGDYEPAECTGVREAVAFLLRRILTSLHDALRGSPGSINLC